MGISYKNIEVLKPLKSLSGSIIKSGFFKFAYTKNGICYYTNESQETVFVNGMKDYNKVKFI